jgi:hypothetical protein
VEELTNKIIVNEAETEDKFEKLNSRIENVDREMRQSRDTFKRNQETTPESQSFGSSYLNNFEFPLPVFDENSDNPVFHLKPYLEEKPGNGNSVSSQQQLGSPPKALRLHGRPFTPKKLLEKCLHQPLVRGSVVELKSALVLDLRV